MRSAPLWLRAPRLFTSCYILWTDIIQLIVIYAKWVIGADHSVSSILLRDDCSVCNQSLRLQRGTQMDCTSLMITLGWWQMLGWHWYYWWKPCMDLSTEVKIRTDDAELERVFKQNFWVTFLITNSVEKCINYVKLKISKPISKLNKLYISQCLEIWGKAYKIQTHHSSYHKKEL